MSKRTLHVVASVSRALALALGAALFIMAISKASSPAPTIASLAWAFGSEHADALARALIITEILVASALLAGVAPRFTLSVSSLMFTAFLAWVGYLAWSGAPVGCGCGNKSEETTRTAEALKAAAFLLVSLTALCGVVWSCRAITRPSLSEGASNELAQGI